jgi:phosphomannomutase
MATLDPTIFKAYDIRAIYPTSINEEVIADVMHSIYTYLTSRLGKKNLTVVLGHDMRLSSPSLVAKAKEILVACGATVIDIGLVATPSVYFTVLKYEYDAGIQISASHNPKEYNGIKMVIRNGKALIKIGKETGMPEIKDIAINKKFVTFTSDGKVEEKKDIIKEEIPAAIEAITPGDISNLKIVADPANAMGIPPLTELFAHIKTNFIPMNFFLDGTFPAHQADPLQHKTLRDLQERVKTEKADLGITTDGDADRVMFVDEKGEIIPATYITALIAGEMLKDFPGEKILVDIRYTRNVENVVKKLGGKIGYTQIGHALITEQTNRENAIFAGESSGHYYFRDVGGCESSMRVILYVLRVLAREQKPISEILAGMKTSIESGEFNFELPATVKVPELLESIISEYKDGTLSRLDGIAIEYPEWRFSIRTSNTEPLLRLNIEGKTVELVRGKVSEIRQYIESTGATLKD